MNRGDAICIKGRPGSSRPRGAAATTIFRASNKPKMKPNGRSSLEMAGAKVPPAARDEKCGFCVSRTGAVAGPVALAHLVALKARRATADNPRMAPEGAAAFVPFAELPLPEDSKRWLELDLKPVGCQKTAHSMPRDPRAYFTGNLAGNGINEFGLTIRAQCAFLAGGVSSGTTIGNDEALRRAAEGDGRGTANAGRPVLAPTCPKNDRKEISVGSSEARKRRLQKARLFLLQEPGANIGVWRRP